MNKKIKVNCILFSIKNLEKLLKMDLIYTKSNLTKTKVL